MINIVIIGAGISGITCARELSKYSSIIDLTVLEASDRIGGRIKTIKADDGTKLELGAHFIHGTKKNAIFDFAIEKGIVEPESNKDVFCESEKPYKIVECFHKDLVSVCSDEKLFDAMVLGNSYNEEIKNDICSLSDEECSRYGTVGNYIIEHFRRKLDEIKYDKELENGLKSIFGRCINEEHHLSGCTSLYDLGLRGISNYIELDGNSHFILSDHCTNGYIDIINKITEDIKIDCIKLNCEVNKIDNVIVDGISKIKVCCTNGNTFYTDATVLTVSVEVLKQFINSNVFSLQLPEAKLSSIKKLCLGNIIKIYFKFLTPVKDDISCFEFYPSPKFLDLPTLKLDDYTLIIDRVGTSDWWLYWMIWDDKNDIENFKTAEYLDKLLISLSDMYPKFPDLKVDIKTIITSDWVNNKFYRGAYSYLKPGSDESDIANLAELTSFGEANLLFAGEATSKNFFSTTHGAYLSGIREAGNIKSIYKLL